MEAKSYNQQQQQQTVAWVCRPPLTNGGYHAPLTPCGRGSLAVTGHQTHLAWRGYWCSETESLLHVSVLVLDGAEHNAVIKMEQLAAFLSEDIRNG
eukprot:scaffold84268_cov19-Tisochrysis_lutea.AAC.1